jgi:murein L,D-transpeptidase YcbB/YkuD
MSTTRTTVGIVAGLAALVALASGGASSPSRPAARASTRRRSSAPKGDVTFGPVTQIKTSPSGGSSRTTSWAGMTTAEQLAYIEAEAKQGRIVEFPGSASSLLSDEQAEALESASIEQARAELPGANAIQLARAKRAAQKAAEVMSKRTVPRIPANPSVRADDSVSRETDPPPRAKLAKPTPINLELARREAPNVAKHLRTKGFNYSRQTVRDFQAHAGIVPDGIYGPLTRSALAYFGVPNPPKALFQAGPTGGSTYAPAN